MAFSLRLFVAAALFSSLETSILALAPLFVPASSFLSTGNPASSPLASTKLFMARIPVLEDWSVLKNGSVKGVVKNHPSPEIGDGDTITTSRLADPDIVAPRKVVVTESGSKYRLGEPGAAFARRNGVKQPPASRMKQPAAVALPSEKDIKRNYQLTGDQVGNYLLAGKPVKSTSGKSQIWTAYRADSKGLPTGDALKVKVSPNKDKMEVEAKNYNKIAKGNFVKCYEYVPDLRESGSRLGSQSALILESGLMNLKELLDQRGPLEGRALRDASVAAVKCLKAIHGARLVWTDLKPENFVVFGDETDDFSKGMNVKGIDLESAIPYGGNPIDYSPEACPPEFAKDLLKGEGPYFVLDFTYDVWSYGILLYELSTAQSAFNGRSQSQITKLLSSPDFEVDVSAVPDSSFRDLVSKCLRTNPKERISVTQILLHPYFLTTGIGGFSF